jgi:hypothetical protein
MVQKYYTYDWKVAFLDLLVNQIDGKSYRQSAAPYQEVKHNIDEILRILGAYNYMDPDDEKIFSLLYRFKTLALADIRGIRHIESDFERQKIFEVCRDELATFREFIAAKTQGNSLLDFFAVYLCETWFRAYSANAVDDCSAIAGELIQLNADHSGDDTIRDNLIEVLLESPDTRLHRNLLAELLIQDPDHERLFTAIVQLLPHPELKDLHAKLPEDCRASQKLEIELRRFEGGGSETQAPQEGQYLTEKGEHMSELDRLLKSAFEEQPPGY